MGRKKIIFTLILICFTLAVFAQQKDSVKVHLNYYTLTIGAGWTHYFNNLENWDNNIQKGLKSCRRIIKRSATEIPLQFRKRTGQIATIRRRSGLKNK